MKNLPSFDDFLNETIEIGGEIFEVANLSIQIVGERGSDFFILINGREYGYRPKGKSLKDLVKTFVGMYKHSQGQALAWLKRNSELISGSKKTNESEEALDESSRIPNASDADKFISEILKMGSRDNLFDRWMKKSGIDSNELSTFVQLVADQIKTKWA